MNENLFGEIQKIENRRKLLQNQIRGVNHTYQMEPMIPQMHDEPILTVTTELDLKIEKIECKILEPEVQSISFELVDTKWDLLNWTYYQVWRVKLPKQFDGALVRYQIVAFTRGGEKEIFADDGEEFSYLVGEMATPEWAKEAIIYQILPDRYNHGEMKKWNTVADINGVYGGTIAGITEKLDYIADLGFNAIWLNPFFPDNTHHGYHATDYFKVNPRMGTMDDIKELVTEAKARGIRLILDFVANHWGSEHDIFKEAQQDKNSDYFNWFYWKNWPDDYECYFDVKDLPKINVDCPAARHHLYKSVRFWLTEIGFDGLRLDHADGPSMNFWLGLRQFVNEIKPDTWLVGEVIKPPPHLLSYQGRIHSMLDFQMAQALRDTFGFGTMNLNEFDSFLGKHEEFFPPNFMGPSFLDNHDMDRFSLISEDETSKIKQAMMCLMTLKNSPIVYYGTEIGLEQHVGKDDPNSHGMAENRVPMIWDETKNKDLRGFVKDVIAFRKDHPVIWKGERKTVYLDSQNGIYSYLITDGKESVLVAFNLGDTKQEVFIDSISYVLKIDAWGAKVEVL